ncbi:MAG: uroporphyrinogen-III synthase [Deltaproteobacteria bacterium]|nr:uroporphyrinogen-III synthase [Deltaproteobacteria bacterium]
MPLGFLDTHEYPLKDLRILVTRPESQARDFMAQLEQAGAIPILLPTIKIVEPPSWELADEAISRLDKYQWLLLTSINGVNCFFQRLQKKGLNYQNCAHLMTICVGPKTAQAAAEFGLKSDMVAKEYAAEGIIELFAGLDISQQKILLPRALKARKLLPESLRQKGADVDVVPVYETIFPTESAQQLNHQLDRKKIDIITITSASSAANLIKHCHDPQTLEKLKKLPTACIGPIAAKTATKVGLNVKITAKDYTSKGLLAALKEYQSCKTNSL